MKKEMEEQLENKNETIVDLHIQVPPSSGRSASRALAKKNAVFTSSRVSQVQWLKKDVEQFAVKERSLQSEKEEVRKSFSCVHGCGQNEAAKVPQTWFKPVRREHSGN